MNDATSETEKVSAYSAPSLEVGHFEHLRRLPGITILYSYGDKPELREHFHTHTDTRLNFYIRGNVTQVNDQKQQAECGPLSLFVTPPDTPHAHIFRSKVLLCCCVALEKEFLVEAGVEKLTDQPLIIRSGPAISTMLRIQSEILSKDTASDLVLRGLFLQLAGELSRKTERKANSPAPLCIRRACALLRDKCIENVSIEEIAREVGVHPSHLARLFREYLNESPGEYLRRHRIAWAAQQVVRTNKPMFLIASEAGFADQAHFARHFKREVGVSPSQYRKGLLA